MFSYGLVYKNRPYFEIGRPNRSKRGSFIDKHDTLQVIDLNFG